MAYPQVPIEMDIYMELPQGIQTATGNSKDHVIKLPKNIYGQKQAGRVWNSFLVDKLISLGYTASLIDDCVFFRGDTISSWSTWTMVLSWVIMTPNFTGDQRDSRIRNQHRGSRPSSRLHGSQHQEALRWFLRIYPACPD